MALKNLPLHDEDPGPQGNTGGPGPPGPPGPVSSELYFGANGSVAGAPFDLGANASALGDTIQNLAPRAGTNVTIGARHGAGGANPSGIPVDYRVTIDGVLTAVFVSISPAVDTYAEATIALVVPIGSRVGVQVSIQAGDSVGTPVLAMVRINP